VNLAALLIDLGRAKVTLRDAGSGLGFAPRSAFTQARAGALVAHKAAALALLRDDYHPPDDDAAYIFLERIGVGIDMGMPTDPGSPAWCIAVGEAMGGTPADPTLADRLAGIVAAVLGEPVRASTLPPGERFPGEPKWP
jgi:hypothetical protein